MRFTMIRINNIKLKPGYSKEDLDSSVRKALKISYTPEYELYKVSIDSRKKNNVNYIISVDVKSENETKIIKKVNSNNIMLTKQEKYIIPTHGEAYMKYRPIIIGTGPAGLFSGLMLAREGYKPVIFERGMNVEARKQIIEGFWDGSRPLNLNSNVQFGEGGAGTFSDGKLSSGIKDKSGRRTEVLKTFADFGADKSILYTNKPHIGTDVLSKVVSNIRKEIIKLGGEVHFNCLMTDIDILDKETVEITVKHLDRNNELTRHKTNALVLAIGHSARDTFEMLYDKMVPMTQKPFAMGLRIEHKRSFINEAQYGDNPLYDELLPAADYKLTYRAGNGRSVYSFCMCPGGYVVNASSEENRMCVNGMSYSGRNGENSNSAIVVNVTPDDFGSGHPLAGMYFQRHWEEKAYEAGNGLIPVQRFGDYRVGNETKSFGKITPSSKGKYAMSNLICCLPEYVKDAIIEGVLSFDKIIPGFADDDAVLSGIEGRTSSPVKILRNEDMVSENTCIYPCGEGAGYAGGITSAAVDGIKTAEAIISKFKK